MTANKPRFFRGTPERPYHISCGGIIYRKTSKNKIEVLLMRRKKKYGWKLDSWHLPKGTQKVDEAWVETAKREAKEETGLEVKAEDYLGSLPSEFTIKGVKIHKTTHYFLLKPLSGALSKTGLDFSAYNGEKPRGHELFWKEIDEAIELASFVETGEEQEEAILKKARRVLQKI